MRPSRVESTPIIRTLNSLSHKLVDLVAPYVSRAVHLMTNPTNLRTERTQAETKTKMSIIFQGRGLLTSAATLKKNESH